MNVKNSSSPKAALKRIFKLVTIVSIAGVFYAGVVYMAFFKDSSMETLLTEDASPRAVLPLCGAESRITPTQKTVVLRVDDIQAYAWRETQLKIMAEAAERDIPLSLGVIPSALTSDPVIVDALRSYHCTHEVALHGYDHGREVNFEQPEFASSTEAEAFERISRGLAELETAGLPTPRTWIPPRNNHSAGTIAALNNLGFTVLSTEGDGEYDYDTTVTDYDYEVLVPPETIVAACERTFETETDCIIMIHPQDFTTGPDHNADLYQTYYIALLDQLEANGYSFARFSDLYAARAE